MYYDSAVLLLLVLILVLEILHLVSKWMIYRVSKSHIDAAETYRLETVGIWEDLKVVLPILKTYLELNRIQNSRMSESKQAIESKLDETKAEIKKIPEETAQAVAAEITKSESGIQKRNNPPA